MFPVADTRPGCFSQVSGYTLRAAELRPGGRESISKELCKKKLKSKGPLILINFNSFQIAQLILVVFDISLLSYCRESQPDVGL